MCEPQNSWINFKERAPAEDGRYLCYDGYEVNIGWYSIKHHTFYDGDGVVVFAPLRNVSEWMALPRPSKRR